MRNIKELDDSKIKILVCCHKPCELPKDNWLLPIQVGAALSKQNLNMQHDDCVEGVMCDSISNRNALYAELTAMYWAWKNIKKIYPNIEYVGLCHYRRYFAPDKHTPFSFQVVQNTEKLHDYRIDKKKISLYLQRYNGVVIKQTSDALSLLSALSVVINCNSYYEMKESVSELFPEYNTTFKNVWEYNGKFSPFNMFIMKYDIFCNYSEWLFSILFQTESMLPIETYSKSEKRIFGMFGERMLNVYMKYNEKKLSFKKVPALFYSDEIKEPSFLYKMFSCLIHRLGAFFVIDLRKGKN